MLRIGPRLDQQGLNLARLVVFAAEFGYGFKRLFMTYPPLEGRLAVLGGGL